MMTRRRPGSGLQVRELRSINAFKTFGWLLIIGLLVFAWACRTFRSRWLGKAGWMAVLTATYLCGYFMTGSHPWGWFAISL